MAKSKKVKKLKKQCVVETFNLRKCTKAEKKFFREALKKYQENIDCWAFYEWALGKLSPLNTITRKKYKTTEKFIKDPVYLAVKELWLELGVNQGYMKASPHRKKYSTRYIGYKD